MLDQKQQPKKSYDETKVATVIGQGTAITGEIKSKGTIRIEGMVSGRVYSEDSIVVHETGKVKADLMAGQVIVGGEVQGNVMAQDRIEVIAKAKLIGDITAPRVSIAEGVVFEGKCAMKAPGPIPAAPQSAPAAVVPPAPAPTPVPQATPAPPK